jgi:nitrite reductase/ring-hydroxylating ferredoxin subunit
MGLLVRPAAAIGLPLNLVVFLTATCHTSPVLPRLGVSAPRTTKQPGDLGPASALAPGSSQAYTDPASGEHALVIRRPDGKLYALSAVCTHAGCDLEYRQDALACPCHNSMFDIRSGVPERGPARRPLATARVEEKDGRIVARPLRGA